MRYIAIVLAIAVAASSTARSADPPAEKRIKILFLGDRGHHRPADRARQVTAVLAQRGIDIRYTEEVGELSKKGLSAYDGLLIYANIGRIEPAQEKALLEFVEGGKGLIPIHCATACFVNSPKYIELVGGQFRRHGVGVFRTQQANQEHPLLKGFQGFESWDETYVHHLHNEKNRIVLSYRVDNEGREPWTWIRTQGKGRVFYTAWGHDHRTWGNAGFQNLLERGIRWAVGRDPGEAPAFSDPSWFPTPKMRPLAANPKPFEYRPAKIAYYPPRGARRGDKWNRMQLPVSPAESMKHMTTPVGFRVELFASEPQIRKPICMNWDERGRLWIAETTDYPNSKQPPGKGRDRISICEDTDGDGKADKFTVFADKLSIPTSLTFSRGGVIVHQPPDTLFLRDNDGDDRADERRVLFTGWDTRDTHAGPSNLQYGFDNWIWGVQGYAGFRGKVGASEHQFGMGVYRFKADGSQLEFLRSTNNNTWGLGFSEDGQAFASTANRNPSVHMPIPNRYYESVRGWSAERLGTIADTHLFRPITDKIRQVDQHGGYTAAAGHALYTARAYPPEYWNRTAFVAGPTGHLLGVFLLKPNGASFRATNVFNLLASDDEWSAPIMAEVGPDGHVWVIDWYNYIVQHNPTPVGFKTGKGNAYETELRDKRHGRVYRVVYGDAVKRSAPNLTAAKPRELVDALNNDNLLWRRHAQRLLVERGQRDVVDDLLKLVENPDVETETGLNTAAIHALWTLHGLGALEEPNERVQQGLEKAFAHRSSGVRSAALRVVSSQGELVRAAVKRRLVDADPRVRLAAALAAARAEPSAVVGKAVAKIVIAGEDANDRWISDALISAAARHDRGFLRAMASLSVGEKTPLAPQLKRTLETVAEHFGRGAPRDDAASLLVALGAASPAVAEAIIVGVDRGWPTDQPANLNQKSERALVSLLNRLPTGVKGRLVRLSESLGSKSLSTYAEQIVGSLLKTVGDEEAEESTRLLSAREAIAFRPRDSKVAAEVIAQITPRATPAWTSDLISALSESETDLVAQQLISRWKALTPSARRSGVALLLRRPTWSVQLIAALEKGTVPAADLSLDQKQQLSAHPKRELAARARKTLARRGGLPNPDRQKVLQQLLPLTRRKGDAARGKQVFVQLCAKCHMHQGEGKKVGPDLSGVAVHTKAELLANVIDPSRSVEGNYRVYNVTTDDGLVLTGLLASESRTAIELYDLEGKKHVILREDIDELIESNKSLMPEGFEKQAKPEQIVDLLEFLTRRGRFLPLPLDKVATIVSTQGMFFSKQSRVERLVFSDWSPKTFAGVPFHLVDPQGDRRPNVVMLHGPQGRFPPRMPRRVALPCNSPARTIHFLSGVSGWGAKGPRADGSVSMIVRLVYKDGQSEDHPLRDGAHFADYIGVFDVPESKLAFKLRGRQIRYLTVTPKRDQTIERIELVKGPDNSAPVVMAVTIEGLP